MELYLTRRVRSLLGHPCLSGLACSGTTSSSAAAILTTLRGASPAQITSFVKPFSPIWGFVTLRWESLGDIGRFCRGDDVRLKLRSQNLSGKL